jgi:8-oxo-dGTP diphosphatase
VTPAGDVVQRVRLAAYGWVEDGGRVLLVRIAPGISASGRWTLPGGGLRFGEDPAAGLLRELREETGLGGRIGSLVAIRSVVLEPHETPSGDRIHAVGVLYRVEVTGGELRNEPDGSTDLVAWIPFPELDALPDSGLIGWARSVTGR